MQYLLNEEEYKEYRKLQKANTVSAVHGRVTREEGITESIINNFHNNNDLGEMKESFNVAMWEVFDKIKSKEINHE